MKNYVLKKSRPSRLNAVFFLMLFVSGCSFHSNQWTAIKSLVEARKVDIPKPWLLSKGGGEIGVYPIAMDASILFTDGKKVFIKFDGWHIVEVSGYGQLNTERSSVHTSRIVLDYAPVMPSFDSKSSESGAVIATGPAEERGTVVYRVSCAEWQRANNIVGELLTQSCAFENDDVFSNSIQLDQSGNIVALDTVLGAGGVKIRLAVPGY